MREQARLADPKLLGLAAFAVAQLLLNIPNAHLVPESTSNLGLSTVIATGGVVQLLCALLEFVRGNTFGTTTFGIYGSFFLALGGYLLMQQVGVLSFGAGAGAAFGTFILVWGLFTVGITAIAFRQGALFGSMFVLISGSFLGAALHYLVGMDSGVGGWCGIVSALLGAYLVFRGLWEAAGVTENEDRVERVDVAVPTL